MTSWHIIPIKFRAGKSLNQQTYNLDSVWVGARSDEGAELASVKGERTLLITLPGTKKKQLQTSGNKRLYSYVNGLAGSFGKHGLLTRA